MICADKKFKSITFRCHRRIYLINFLGHTEFTKSEIVLIQLISYEIIANDMPTVQIRQINLIDLLMCEILHL